MKALAAIFTIVLSVVFVASPAVAQEKSGGQRSQSSIKYDFTLVRKDGGMSNWGSLDQAQNERFQRMGPGLYVRKDGATYVITDPETIRKAEQELAVFKQIKDKLKATRKSHTDDARAKEMARRAQEQTQVNKKITEQTRSLVEQMRNAKDQAAKERLRQQMQELREQLRAQSRERAKMWRDAEFGKEMAEFGRQMGETAREVGGKISRLIDEAFAKGLAIKI